MIGFINTFFYNLSLSQSIIALPLIYPLHESLGQAPFSLLFSIVFPVLLVLLRICRTEYESYVTTDGQSVSLSWNKSSIWGLRPDFYYCQTVVGLLMWGVLSDERTGLSLTVAAGPRKRSHSGIRVPWDSPPYFTVSDWDLSFCRFLRVAGLWWRYSTQLPHGILCCTPFSVPL
jgi:hypothetical protein